jgi:beta-lactamase regulating signal transducer with metallopeptidase domain
MMMPFLQLAPLAAERVVNAIPGGLLIAAVAWVLLLVVGRQNSGTRFAVWFCALLAVAGLPFISSVSKAAPVTHAVRSEIVLPGFWAVGIFAVWILIAALATMRIVVGLWKLRRMRSTSLPLTTSSFPPAIQLVVAQFKSGRRVTVCRSSAVTVPTAIGFFRPVILIPDWVLQDLSAEELKVILLHEFAHLRRWDDWTNLAQKLVRTIFFFHPAVWWIEKRLSLEREMACDEAVLAETENPQAYAECLVSLAEKSFVRRGLALAQAVVGRARETSLRLARILDGNRPKSSRVFRPALGLVAALAVCCVVALPDAPKLIAFENAGPTPVINNNNNVSFGAGAAPELPQTAVIPAAERTAEVPLRAAVPRKSVAAGIYRPTKFSEARGTRQTQIEARPVMARPVMVRASAQEEVAPQVQLVMQMTQYDERGSAIFNLSVWRVTFESGNQQAVRQEVIVRSL